ncbi:MAG: DUF120 domain-containing protein [Candidatus Aenigmarchaeota archaeon]|nr:DUF120 domain-containing protein [Candidatus Aenigmarchaeota archaeon]
MKVRGTVVSGVLRGSIFIEIIHPRLVGMLGFHPYKGTLNVKLERPIDIRLHATKKVEHILTDGTHNIDAYLAPVTLTFKDKDISCWAMRQARGVYGNDILEIVYHESLKDTLSMQDGDDVVVTFDSLKKTGQKFKIPGAGLLKRLYGREAQVMKS